MANISVTYTFSNGSTADATEVNTNFQDIIDGTSDGTKDFSISALTCAGTLTANGNVNLGNATSDDITITGRIAADIDPKTASATDLGDSTQLWRAAYVDNFLGSINAVGDPTYSFHADTDTGMYSTGANTLDFATGGTRALYIDSSQVVRPVTAIDMDGAKIRTLATEDVSIDATGADIDWSSNAYTILDTDTYVNFYCTTVSTDRTLNLPTAADNNGRIIQVKKVDSGTGSLTIDGEGAETIDGATTIVLYSQFESVTLQCDGTEWHITDSHLVPNAEIKMVGGNTSYAFGSSATKIRAFQTALWTRGTGVTQSTTSGAGSTFTIVDPGVYYVAWHGRAPGAAQMGLSVNTTQTSTNIASLINASERLAYGETDATNEQKLVAVTSRFSAGDVIRAHSDGTQTDTSQVVEWFCITQVARTLV